MGKPSLAMQLRPRLNSGVVQPQLVARLKLSRDLTSEVIEPAAPGAGQCVCSPLQIGIPGNSLFERDTLAEPLANLTGTLTGKH
jgi:hypothetical protein